MERRSLLKTAAIGLAASAAVSTSYKANASGTLTCPNGYIDVTTPAYGADPTGATSSATAFTNAVADAAALNAPLWVPAGTYDLVGMSPLAVGNLEIVGGGRDFVRLLGSENSALAYPQEGGFIRISGISAEGFRRIVQYSQGVNLKSIEIYDCYFSEISEQVIGSGGGVNIGTIDRVAFERCVALQIGTHSSDVAVVKVTAGKCKSATISNNIVIGVGTSGNTNKTYAFHVRTSNYDDDSDAKTIIASNDIRNVISSGNEDCCGIMVLGGQASITGNHLQEVNSLSTSSTDNEGIYIKCRNSVISDNTLIDCGGKEGVIILKGANRGVTPTLGTGTPGFDNVVTNNTIRQDESSSRWTVGIAVSMDGVVVSGNNIQGTQKGISIWAGVSSSIVANNVIGGLVDHQPGSPVYGIEINSPNGCQIKDNKIFNLTNMTASVACYGIIVAGSATAFKGCIIKGNEIDGVSSATSNYSRGIAVNLHASGACDRIIVESNHIAGVDMGIQCFNMSTASLRYLINNSVVNYSSSDFSPSSTSWTEYSGNQSV